ncbi:DMT family transporter [Shewanella acanthi]|uniref:DMT family transporter n=1 Tax=Shewanella acanthi TaxID=2864212 RepID=UPI001C655157|nr:DMT family transporter [Shewanella acanthi]QYJ77377.1 DMT family transporter [Shewanella acanthi]
MTSLRLFLLTSLTMLAFACNSILCRLALKDGSIDASSFTAIRLISGALMLSLLSMKDHKVKVSGQWGSALALFSYAAGFSYAYIHMTASMGALLLFAAVQATMIGHGLYNKEKFNQFQWAGLVFAALGLVFLLLPGLSAPPLFSAFLMIVAGISWGIYSIRGKGAKHPIQSSAGNFIRTIPLSLLLLFVLSNPLSVSGNGIVYAILSGALASGVGYAIWYNVLPSLSSSVAATVQLSVPLITAVAGVLFLGESFSLRLLLSSLAILGGITLVVLKKDTINSK